MESTSLNTLSCSWAIDEPYTVSPEIAAHDNKVRRILNEEGEGALLLQLAGEADFKYRAFLAIIALRGILSAPTAYTPEGKEVGAKSLIKELLVAIHTDVKDPNRRYCTDLARWARAVSVKGQNPFECESVSALAALAGKPRKVANEPSIKHHERLESERLEASERARAAYEAQQAQELESKRLKEVADKAISNLEAQEAESKRLQDVADKAISNLEAQELESKFLKERLAFLESLLNKTQLEKYRAKFA